MASARVPASASAAKAGKLTWHVQRANLMHLCSTALQTQVHNAQSLIGDSGAGGKSLRPVASPLEKEIRSSLLAIAEEQGADGHRSCLTKFSELLLLNGVISTQQMGVALDLVEALFEPGACASCCTCLISHANTRCPAQHCTRPSAILTLDFPISTRHTAQTAASTTA